MSQPEENPFRVKVIVVGSAVTAAVFALGYFTIPQKPIDNTQKVEDLNNLKLAAEIEKNKANAQNLPTLDAKEGYQRFCQQCHGENGTEETALSRTMEPSPTNLKFGPFKKANSKQEIVAIILDGFKNEKGENTMPGFSGNMSRESAENIAEFTLSLRPKQKSDSQENSEDTNKDDISSDTATENK